MSWKLVVGLIFGLLFTELSLGAEDLSFSRNARTFETQQSSLVIKGLAHSCLTMTTIPDGLLCNPAHTPFNKKSSLGIELLLSNGSKNLTNLQKLINGNVSQELVDTLFLEGQTIQIEANAEIYFQSKYLSGRYTPLTVKGFSIVRNEANPDIELYAIEENGFAFQSGYEVYNDFYVGI